MIKRKKSLSFRGRIRTLTVVSLPRNDRIHLLTEKLAEFAARKRQTASLLAENSAGIFASLKKDGPSRNRPFNLYYSKNYLPMFIWAATSAAKSSCFFSMPSPVAKRTAFTNFTEPPSFLAASAM